MPEEWAVIELSQIVQYRKGKKPKRMESTPFENSLVYLDIRAIEKNVNEQYVDRETSNSTNENDLIVVWDGARAGWVGKSRIGALGSTIMALTPKIDKGYLFYYLQTQFSYIQSNHRGTGIPHVDPDIFWNIHVPIPPLPEQHRIVAKLDALVERVERNKQRIDKIPKLLKRFRQSVLAAAVSGRLTEGWRQENGISDDWKEKELGSLTSLVTSGSRGWAKYYSESGSVFVRAQNISQETLNLDDIAFVKLPSLTEGIRTLIKKDDLLVTITGANVTKTARVEFEISDAYVSQHVALVRLKDIAFSKFIYYNLISNLHGRKQLLLAAYGQGKPQLNLDNIKSVNISLPEKEETIEIVRRVEQLFSFADKIEARYTKAKAMLNKLPQSILAKAFRGELVPQDPNDEPASVLLERIKAEKEERSGKKKAKVTKNKATSK